MTHVKVLYATHSSPSMIIYCILILSTKRWFFFFRISEMWEQQPRQESKCELNDGIQRSLNWPSFFMIVLFSGWTTTINNKWCFSSFLVTTDKTKFLIIDLKNALVEPSRRSHNQQHSQSVRFHNSIHKSTIVYPRKQSVPPKTKNEREHSYSFFCFLFLFN